jgi:hypothetical protein
MMERLMKRGEELAREGQKRALVDLAAQLKSLLKGAAIQVDDARILVTGRAIVARWFFEPRLRFLDRGSK